MDLTENELDNTNLRRRAEAVYDKMNKNQTVFTGLDAEKLIYELQVHQIELEMQNEELQRTQVNLNELLEQYFELYDMAPAGYFTINKKGIIVRSNLTFAKLLQVVRNGLIGAPFSKFIHPFSQDQYYLNLKSVINTGLAQTCELRLLNNGPGFFGNIYMSPVFDNSNELKEIRIVVTDISELKKAQDQISHLNKQLLEAHENERMRISWHLHDNVAQELAAAKMNLENIISVKDGLSPKVSHEIQKLSDLLCNSIKAVRDLSYDLRPPLLDDLGLEKSLRELYTIFSRKTGLHVEFSFLNIEDLQVDKNMQINIYRIIQESLRNIQKHADAGNIEIKFIYSGSEILIDIKDDGTGFDTVDSQPGSSHKIGLRSMTERAAAIGGQMEILSERGSGTRITVKIPLAVIG